MEVNQNVRKKIFSRGISPCKTARIILGVIMATRRKINFEGVRYYLLKTGQ